MHPRTEPPRLTRWEDSTEWPLAAAALIFLAAYSIRVLLEPQGRVETAVDLATWITWGLFLIDYLIRLSLAAERSRWFFRHLPDLAIVALPLLRPLRLLRLVVLVAALQKAIGGAIRGRVVVYTAFSVVLLIYVASLAVLEAERFLPDSKITNFQDAVWWSIATITTVGYGDLYPVSATGRAIAVLLMIGGISLLGVVTATLASWIVERVAEEDTAKTAATSAHIDTLRDEAKRQNDALRADVQRLSELFERAKVDGPERP